MSDLPGYSKFLVIGLPGIGKTTFSERLARKFKIPHIEGDRYFWVEGEGQVEVEEFRKKIDGMTEKGRWIYEGHYRKVYDLICDRVDTMIWIDLPFFTALKRNFIRSKQQIGLKRTLTEKQGPFLWLIFNGSRMLRDYKQTLKDYEDKGVPTFRLTKSEQLENWLKSD